MIVSHTITPSSVHAMSSHGNVDLNKDISKHNSGVKYCIETLVVKTSIINNKHTWKDVVVKSYELKLKITKKIHNFPT